MKAKVRSAQPRRPRTSRKKRGTRGTTAAATHRRPRVAGVTTTTKLAVSFDKKLARAVEEAADQETGGNVSAWLAEAAREHLRFNAMREALRVYQAEHGALTPEQVAEAERLWPEA